MSLFDAARDDAKDILEDKDGFTVPVLFTSPPEETNGIPANTEFGTLVPDDYDNQIRAFVGDHYTQLNPDIGVPQAGLNAKATLTLKTLLDQGIISSASDPYLENFKVSWLDVTSAERRDFLVIEILPTRSLSHIVILLGEIDIT